MSADPHAVAEQLRPKLRSINLTEPRSIFIVGIGGAGMRAIAQILVAMGHQVSGSDRSDSSHLAALAALGVTTYVGHHQDHIAGAHFLARSTAVGDDSPEVAAALSADVPVYSRAEILAAVAATRPAILVAGTHGKTTTSSLLAVMLDGVGRSPSFVIGSDVNYFGTGARWTNEPDFVVEADESDGTFLALPSNHAIVTSLDPDHLEYYGTAARLTAAFEAFVDSVDGVTALCVDDLDAAALADRSGVVTYGTSPGADLRLSDIRVGERETEFDVHWQGDRAHAVVPLPGLHNALNAGGALVIGLSLGVPLRELLDALASFSGVARRFEDRGAHLGVRFVDDYAHLPAEVETMIATAKQGPWRRVIATYQPHRFSRTQELGATFARSFRGVDHLVLTDIFPAGESPRPGVTGRIVFDAVVASCPDLSVRWQPTLDDVADHLCAVVGPGDLCLTLGAGDLTTIPDRVLRKLRDAYPIDVEWLVSLSDELTDSTVILNASLGQRTTYRVGGAALALVEVGSRTDLQRVLQAAHAAATPVLPLGNGSNTLISDSGFLGIAIVLNGEFDAIEIEGTTVRLGAGVRLPAVARRLVQEGLTGFEWAVGVPGTIGGAVVMNAGGHGSDMAANLTSATVLDSRTGETTERGAAELALGYRSSGVSKSEVILAATLELTPGDRTTGETLLRDIVQWRRANQPGGQNAGSVFTNPAGDSAGRLIDAAGCKGLRVGSAEVSPKHANFIQADPDGRADDVHELMTMIQQRVQDDFGVWLQPESRLVGFDR